jgi:hypothetical protein
MLQKLSLCNKIHWTVNSREAMFIARWILNVYHIFLCKLIEMQINFFFPKDSFVPFFTSVLYRNVHRLVILC